MVSSAFSFCACMENTTATKTNESSILETHELFFINPVLEVIALLIKLLEWSKIKSEISREVLMQS
jgi:hypothetical protein